MSSLGRHQWRIAVVSLVIGIAVVLSLGSTYASTVQDDASAQVMSAQRGPQRCKMKKINDDPFTNSTSNHNTQVEPGSFSFGNTIVTAEAVGSVLRRRRVRHRLFHVNRWRQDVDDRDTASDGVLGGGGPYARTSDVTVAYDAEAPDLDDVVPRNQDPKHG